MPVASTAYFEESTEQVSPKMLQPGDYSYSLTHFPEAGTPGEKQYFDPTTDLLVLVEVMSGGYIKARGQGGHLKLAAHKERADPGAGSWALYNRYKKRLVLRRFSAKRLGD